MENSSQNINIDDTILKWLQSSPLRNIENKENINNEISVNINNTNVEALICKTTGSILQKRNRCENSLKAINTSIKENHQIDSTDSESVESTKRKKIKTPHKSQITYKIPCNVKSFKTPTKSRKYKTLSVNYNSANSNTQSNDDIKLSSLVGIMSDSLKDNEEDNVQTIKADCSLNSDSRNFNCKYDAFKDYLNSDDFKKNNCIDQSTEINTILSNNKLVSNNLNDVISLPESQNKFSSLDSYLENYSQKTEKLSNESVNKNLEKNKQSTQTCDNEIRLLSSEIVENSKSYIDTSFVDNEYRKELDQIFSKVENTICELGSDKQNVTIKDQTADVFGNSVWFDDVSFTNVMVNMPVNGTTMGDVLKKALLQNISKPVKSNQLINTTLIENESNFIELGPFYGLPNKVKELIKFYRGIDKLYDWQDECLSLPAIANRKNLIYSLPTSGGKTLVAEVLMLREVLCRKRNALFILPFVAIVQEKVCALSPFAVALDILIEEYASSKGTYPPRKRRRKHSIYIATIEKALSLINSLYENGRINEIGLVVVDELHLMGEPGRGSTLEALLTKIICLNENIHIVGMSATIGNLSEVSTFLNADVYIKNFRPVELIEYIKCGNDIAKINWNTADEDNFLTFVRREDFSYSSKISALDPDRIGGLVMEVIPKGSCLIFCSSKKNCENVTLLLCKVLYSSLVNYKKKEKELLLQSLKKETGCLCKILNISVQFGVAYHHSGLTSEERKLIEDGFRAGVLSVICCTSTLAAGVNLPAKRVILRQPYVGLEFISLSRYKQMVGRAGRAGLGETGESILICNRPDLPKVIQLLKSPMNEVISKMHDYDAMGLSHLLLSCISLGIANTISQLQQVTNKTLMAVQTKRLIVNPKELTKQVIINLYKLNAIKLADKDSCSSDNDVTFHFNSLDSSFSVDGF